MLETNGELQKNDLKVKKNGKKMPRVLLIYITLKQRAKGSLFM